MRILLIGMFLVCSAKMYAQNLKTIFTNDSDAVALFFPSPIQQALTGSKNFIFSYNRENPQHVGIVQGVKGGGSNLLVITANGDVYSYRLAYRNVLDTMNYFINANERIGNEVPASGLKVFDFLPNKISPIKPYSMEADTLMNRREYIRKFSSYHLEHDNNLLKRKRKNRLVLGLKDLIYDRTEVYAVIEIRNRSGIDFEVDYLKVYKINGNNRRKSSYQKLPLAVLHEQNFPDIIKDGESSRFAVVLPKFTLGDSEKLMLELKELHGSRNIRLFYR